MLTFSFDRNLSNQIYSLHRLYQTQLTHKPQVCCMFLYVFHGSSNKQRIIFIYFSFFRPSTTDQTKQNCNSLECRCLAVLSQWSYDGVFNVIRQQLKLCFFFIHWKNPSETVFFMLSFVIVVMKPSWSWCDFSCVWVFCSAKTTETRKKIYNKKPTSERARNLGVLLYFASEINK